MKRAHKKTHLILWIVLAIVIVSTLVFAVLHRPAAPLNDILPDSLLEEAR